MQLFNLLILTKSELPDDIIGYITENNYMSFNMDFLKITKLRKLMISLSTYNLQIIAGVNILVNLIDKEQELQELSEAGVESGSTLINNFNLLFTLIMILIIHLFLIWLPKKSSEETEDMSKAQEGVLLYFEKNMGILHFFCVYQTTTGSLSVHALVKCVWNLHIWFI